ncbi:Protein MAINTENANCE OF MERISTEMS, partial [Camellia lanceoleosa]
MADDIPHDGASSKIPPQLSPEMEAELELVLLPPKIRPFDLTTYHPWTYVLPPESIWHFSKFDSHSIQGYRATSVREWHMDLPFGVRQIIDEAGFDLFCTGLSHLITSRPLLGALVERWWDTTNSFHFSTARDMTMTPYDFAMLTGIEVRGRPIPYDTDMDEWEAAWIYLLGARPPLFRSGMVRCTWFSEHFRGIEPETLKEIMQYARGFLMFLFGTTLFADRANTVGLYLLSALVDLSRVWLYDWGGAGLATLYGYMSSTSRRSGNRVGGFLFCFLYPPCILHSLHITHILCFLHYLCLFIVYSLLPFCFLQLWIYAYFSTLAPEPEVETPPVVPYSHRYDGRCVRRTRETFSLFRRYFDIVTAVE